MASLSTYSAQLEATPRRERLTPGVGTRVFGFALTVAMLVLVVVAAAQGG